VLSLLQAMMLAAAVNPPREMRLAAVKRRTAFISDADFLGR
jgi:hypothetical protein